MFTISSTTEQKQNLHQKKEILKEKMKVFLSLAVILALVMMVYGNGTPCGNILLYLLYYLLFIAIDLYKFCLQIA